MRISDEMVEVVARQRFHRAHPYIKADTWEWMPFNAKRQWLEEAREDLQLAMAKDEEGVAMPGEIADLPPTALLRGFVATLGNDLARAGQSRLFNLGNPADCERLARLLEPFLVDDRSAP